jgi:hypothetical protein
LAAPMGVRGGDPFAPMLVACGQTLKFAAELRRRKPNPALFYPLMLGASGNLFTLSEIILLSCMTCWLKAAYSSMSR